MKSVSLSLLTFAIMGALALGQPPATPGDPIPKVATPGGEPKEKEKPAAESIKTPEDPLLKEALDFFKENKVDKCLAKLKEATDKNKELQPPEIIFAGWLVQAKNGSDARKVLELFIARNVAHPDGYLLNAQFAYGEGRVTDAIYSCLTALNYSKAANFNTKQQDRFDREARLGLVACLEARGDFNSMVEHLQALVKGDDKNAALRQRLAAVKFNLGNDTTALSELEEAYKLDPLIDPPELRLGALWASKAAADLGLKADEKDKDVIADAVKKKIAEYRGKAEAKLMEAVKKYPTNAKAPRGLASFYLEEGRLPDAMTAIDQAKAIDKNDPKLKDRGGEARETSALQALYHRYKGEYEPAVGIFEKLFTENPSDPFATGNLSICLMERGKAGDMDRATNLATSLVKQNEKSAEAFAVLGWVLFNASRKEADDKKKTELLENADKALGASASGGQAMLDTAYYLAEFFNHKKEYKKAFDLLKEATSKKGAFVYRVKAEKLMTALEVPAKEDEAKKKDEEKKKEEDKKKKDDEEKKKATDK